MNIVLLVGRLTRDPEEQGEGEQTRARFSVAVDRIGEGTDFISCTAFGKQAENMLKYCTKGTMVSVEGAINTYSYENEEGNRVSGMNVTARRVQFLSSKNSSENGTPTAEQTRAEERAEEQSLLKKAIYDFDAEIVEEQMNMELPFE